MKITVAKSAGFCFGVERAVRMCETAAEKYDLCVMYGEITHNRTVLDDLSRRGVQIACDIGDIPAGAAVVIRAHGVTSAEHAAIADKAAAVLDATCPLVAKIHAIVRRAEADGYLPVVIGHREHAEVRGVAGQVGHCEIFADEAELRTWIHATDSADKKLAVVFQTTLRRDIFDNVYNFLKKVCTNGEIFDTICATTLSRYKETETLAKTSDVMLVIGDPMSANTRGLYEIAKRFCDRTYFLEGADGLPDLSGERGISIGVTAGASTPACIIKEVNQKMLEETEIIVGENDERVAKTAEPVAENAEPVAEAIEPAAEAAEPELVAPVAESEPVEPAAEPAAPVAESEPAEPESEPEPVAETAEQTEAAADESPAEPEPAAAPEEPPAAAEAPARQETFEEMLEKSIKTLHTGDKVTGTVAAITPTEISVDLGIKQSGYIPLSELTDDPTKSPEDIVQVGDEVEAFVMRVNDVEGTVQLSRRRLDAVKNWEDIERALKNRTVVEGFVTEENKGGIVVMVRGIRVFVPASRTGLPRESPMTELVKKNVRLMITEVNQPRRRVVGSISAVANEDRKQKAENIWAEIEVGKRYHGVVKSMTSYGAFVDVGGVDGMVHVSELSWSRIRQPSDILNIGDEIDVFVISYDPEKRKIQLGCKDRSADPWTLFTGKHSIGDVVNVKVVKLMKYGAFAEILPGVDGLIHVSQIADHRIGEPGDVLSEGQTVDVKITNIDMENKQVSLSIRALLTEARRTVQEEDREPASVVYDTDTPEAYDDPEEEPEA